VFTIFVLTIAACEAGLALALVLGLYQRRKSLDVQMWANLGEPDLPRLAPDITAAAPASFAHPDLPHLTPAGPAPTANPTSRAPMATKPGKEPVGTT
jgi:NADH-quinone oxidoreductase subunit K